MSVIVGYTAPTAASEFGQVLRNCEFAQIDLDRLASGAADASLVRYFWVHEGDPAAFRETLEASAIVDRVEVLDDLEEAFLCRVSPSDGWHGVGELVHEQDAVIVDASATPEQWRGCIRFHTQEGATAFQQACHSRGIPLTITDVHELRTPTNQSLGDEVALTAPQQEFIELALDRGYFEIPRRATLVELGEEIGVSDQALSERLRRAHATFAGAVVNRGAPTVNH